MKQAVLMENISKQFGEVIANHQVHLEVKHGEIHALLGENGAGKSTLMNILSGIYTPDFGRIYLGEKEVHIQSPKQAIQLGIGMVHQHFKLVESFSVKENILAGDVHGVLLNDKKAIKKIEKIMEDHHLFVPLNKKVEFLSVGEKQRVEIIKMLYRGAKILILDEPTAVLTPQEVIDLYQVLKQMKNQGCAIIVITHKLHEVMTYCDRVSVLRKGQNVLETDVTVSSQVALTEAMVGKAMNLEIKRPFVEHQNVLLSLDRVSIINKEKIKILDRISFDLHEGEILGVAGIAGSGQKELCEAIAGLHKITDGKILYQNETISGLNPRQIIQKCISMSFIPEDRLQMGLVPNMDIVDNLLLKTYYKQKGIFINRQPVELKAKELVKKLDIVTPSINTPVRLLSGGNIQKVLLGREIDMKPKVIVTAYAVRGLDIHATHQIYELFNQQKIKGCGVLFIGEDLDVLLELCDRIAVLCDGKLMGVVNSRKANKETVGLMMAGEVYKGGNHETN